MYNSTKWRRRTGRVQIVESANCDERMYRCKNVIACRIVDDVCVSPVLFLGVPLVEGPNRLRENASPHSLSWPSGNGNVSLAVAEITVHCWDS